MCIRDSNQSDVSTASLGYKEAITSSILESSVTNNITPKRLIFSASANSANANVLSTSKRLREGTSQNSANVVTNSLGTRTAVGLVHVQSKANLTQIPFRISQLQFGLSSSVNLDSISDILWEALDKETGNPSNVTYTDLSAGSSTTWNELENP